MQTTRLCLTAAICAASVALMTGCTSFHIGPGRMPQNMDVSKGSAYASIHDLRSYNGDLIDIDIFDDEQQPGELLNVELWPIVGVGIGLFGVRAHIVNVGAGAGTFLYSPHAANRYRIDRKVNVIIVDR
ncbi:hypothetical protein BH09SUM1_BH09SUM1_34330 [soil metagenome]